MSTGSYSLRYCGFLAHSTCTCMYDIFYLKKIGHRKLIHSQKKKKKRKRERKKKMF